MNLQTALKVVGVVVVGALGSALWDLSKPVVFWLWTNAVTISSLGIQSLTDDLYAKAASQVGRGFPASFVAQSLAGLIFCLGAAVMQALSFSTVPDRARFYVRTYMYVFLAGTVVMTLQLVRTTYSLSLARDYERLELVMAPYLSDAELKKQRATMVRVATEADFEKIMADLKERATAVGEKPLQK